MSKSGHETSVMRDPLIDRARDASRPILLIGFLHQENLGLGYLSAMLRRYGYKVVVLDFEADAKDILRVARACNPLIVGLSLIFQFYLPRFASLVSTLRDGVVDCHFTIGGHFPSLSYSETIKHIPELDSVVRFEGEETLLELADVLSTGGDFRAVAGLAYASADGIACSPLRSLVHDLNSLPYPDRKYERRAFLGRNSTYMLASRGCIRTCSFCSIHMFYRSAPGKVVRLRTPQNVVEEMQMLYDEHDITLFLFQDDDFPVYGAKWRQWARDFCDELHRTGLADRILWKISCRADAVDADLFARMRDSGLYLVYMGLESGNEAGLISLNKSITVEQNIAAVDTLKQLGIRFEFGFMLFEPSTTFATVREDLAFLRRIVGDGSTAAGFCRMVPYDGTPIKDELIKSGRLRGDVCNPYYDFLDPKLGEFCYDLGQVLKVTGWMHGLDSVSQTLNVAWSEFAVMERLFSRLPDIDDYRVTLKDITRSSNALLFAVIEDIADFHEHRRPHSWSAGPLRERCKGFVETFLAERDAFVSRNQDAFLASLDVGSRAPEAALSA
jgi:anaerobic magnesium-protoporphyrin IX monomethyl ester cyclase